jgi:hypothetical protein
MTVQLGEGPNLVKCLKILEARGGIEPPIMVLQTIALPLGDRATGREKSFQL